MGWSDIIAVIGAATGIYSCYRVSKFEKQDLRISRSDLYTTIQVEMSALPQLCKEVNQSKISRLNAQGLYHSGTMKKWEIDYAAFEKEIESYKSEFEKIVPNALTLKQHDLEVDISTMQLLDKKIKALIKKFEESVIEDTFCNWAGKIMGVSSGS